MNHIPINTRGPLAWFLALTGALVALTLVLDLPLLTGAMIVDTKDPAHPGHLITFVPSWWSVALRATWVVFCAVSVQRLRKG